MVNFFFVRFIFEFLSLLPVTLQSPFGVQCSNLKTRAPARVVTDGLDGWTGWRWAKRSFNFFLFRAILNTIPIYTYIYIKRLSRQISCGFKNFDKLGVRKKKIKNTPLVSFLKISLKVTYLQKKQPVNFTGNSFVNFTGISLLNWRRFQFKRISLIKWNVI